MISPTRLAWAVATLGADNKIELLTDEYRPQPGHIVEFGTSLRRNPLIHAMDTFAQLFDMAIALDAVSTKGSHKNKLNEITKIKSQVISFSEMLKTGDTIDIVSDELPCGPKAVITLDT